MSMIILNGSPKAERGNTEIFIRKFIEGMQGADSRRIELSEVCYSAKEDYEQLANKLQEHDEIIITFPLYVHAMPGSVRKIMEFMKPVEGSGKKLSFIIQYGFIEGAQSKYLVRYLESFIKKMNYESAGIVTRGGSAGIYEMPEKMNQKLFQQLQKLGKDYVETGVFSKEVIECLHTPYELTKKQARMYEFMAKAGLSDAMWWNSQLKRNGAMKHRYGTDQGCCLFD